jgi:hypothetical protein
MGRKADSDGGHSLTDGGEGEGHLRGFERLYTIFVPRMQMQLVRAGSDDIERIPRKFIRCAWHASIEILGAVPVKTRLQHRSIFTIITKV